MMFQLQNVTILYFQYLAKYVAILQIQPMILNDNLKWTEATKKLKNLKTELPTIYLHLPKQCNSQFLQPLHVYLLVLFFTNLDINKEKLKIWEYTIVSRTLS